MRQYIVDAMMGLEGRGHLLGDALVQEMALIAGMPGSRFGGDPDKVSF